MNEEVRHERELREEWERAHEHVHELEHEAINKAEDAVNLRLEGMNELRAQINTERGKYVTRETFDAVNSSTDGRLKTLENNKSNLEGRFWAIGAAFVILNVAIAVASWWGHR
jgi:DNA repair exonuclease SbcCD ATPase subunit